MSTNHEPCINSSDEVFLCNACGKPIMKDEYTIHVEVSRRHNMGNRLIGYKHFHESCVSALIEEYTNATASFVMNTQPKLSGKTKIMLGGRGYGRSFGNMIEIISGDASKNQEGNWIVVSEKKQGVFDVIEDNMTEKGGNGYSDKTALGFSQWDKEVSDLDAGHSDASQCFGISEHLEWHDVDMTPYIFEAPNIERLKEALEHVLICAWCPGDI